MRLPSQRKADALEHVVDLVLDAGALPTEGGERPHLNLGVDLDRIAEQSQRDDERRRAAASRDWFALTDEQRAARVRDALADADAATDPASGRPRYYWTGSASVVAARRLACDATVLPIFTRGGTPLDVGRHTRVISNAMRQLIVRRDAHCRWPGCSVPDRWCDVHHAKHWKDGGTTDRWNLVLLCEHHHKAAHDGRFTVVVRAPGVIGIRPRGRPDDPYYDIKLKAPPDSFDLDSEIRRLASR